MERSSDGHCENGRTAAPAHSGKLDVRPRIVIVDDDEHTLVYLQEVIRLTDIYDLGHSYSNATEALAGIPQNQADLAIIDIGLPDLNGIECTRRLKHVIPRLKVILICGTFDAKSLDASVLAGVVGFLVKPLSTEQLMATLYLAACSKPETNRLSRDTQSVLDIKRRNGRLPLSSREREVLSHFAEGLLYKEIAEKLGISFSAVHKHAGNIYKKLGARNRPEAIRAWLGWQAR